MACMCLWHAEMIGWSCAWLINCSVNSICSTHINFLVNPLYFGLTHTITKKRENLNHALTAGWYLLPKLFCSLMLDTQSSFSFLAWHHGRYTKDTHTHTHTHQGSPPPPPPLPLLAWQHDFCWPLTWLVQAWIHACPLPSPPPLSPIVCQMTFTSLLIIVPSPRLHSPSYVTFLPGMDAQSHGFLPCCTFCWLPPRSASSTSL